MRNNILGGLVIFFVVMACLLLLDDISNTNKEEIDQVKSEVETVENENNLAVIDDE